MDGNRSRRVALAVLAVIAVGLVAAAAAPLFEQEPGSQAPSDVPTGNASTEETDPLRQLPVEYVGYAVAAIVVIAIAVQFVTDPWGTLKKAIAGAVVAAIIVGIVYVAFEFLSSLEATGLNESVRPGVPDEMPSNGSAAFGESDSDSPLVPTGDLAIIVLVAALLGGISLVVFVGGGIRTALGLGDSESEEAPADLGALGQAAGQAADDIESAPTATAADNAIYRAWSEMVALLDAPDPQSGTPRQFASAAIDAGMNRREVDVLTRTFEEVRYGDAALSPERRERATEALRRIEATYGEEDGSGDSE